MNTRSASASVKQGPKPALAVTWQPLNLNFHDQWRQMH